MASTGTKGVVKYPYYKNGGKFRFKGLRNNRAAYWSKVHLLEKRKLRDKE